MTSLAAHFPRLTGAVALAALGAAASAQCTYTWPTAAFGTGVDAQVRAATTRPNGDLVVGGYLQNAGGVATSFVATWNGTGWAPLGSGVNFLVQALTTMPNGDVIAAGNFDTAGGVTARCVARWNGTQWSALGAGIDAPLPVFTAAHALAVAPNGDLLVGGDFLSAGGVPCNRIARWNGTTWQALGTGVDGSVRAVAVTPNGDVFVAGSFATAGGVAASGVARWNGSQWSGLGTGLGFFGANALAALPNGDVVAGGVFTLAGGVPANRVARWDGTQWNALGSGLDGICNELLALPNGWLAAGGSFQHAGGVAAPRVAVWDGAAWHGLGGGADNGSVQALAFGPALELVIAGDFTSAGGSAAGRVARVGSSCTPTSAPFGSGCTGSGGLNTLVPLTLPWVDATFRATASGLTTFGFAVALTSVTAVPPGVVPLGTVFPQALPGCDLLVAPDILETLVTLTGTVTSTLFLPDTPPLVGVTFYHQVVTIELDLQGSWTAITATNALQLTAGGF
ncbi:MAG: hypothetical protein JNL08_15720 [Planctomycetes bacterium]|nr:hypothetical protein [Planctomycetota bacterium]